MKGEIQKYVHASGRIHDESVSIELGLSCRPATYEIDCFDNCHIRSSVCFIHLKLTSEWIALGTNHVTTATEPYGTAVSERE
jgi:hypothetical protein